MRHAKADLSTENPSTTAGARFSTAYGNGGRARSAKTPPGAWSAPADGHDEQPRQTDPLVKGSAVCSPVVYWGNVLFNQYVRQWVKLLATRSIDFKRGGEDHAHACVLITLPNQMSTDNEDALYKPSSATG
jgi:hypothetical protein